MNPDHTHIRLSDDWDQEDPIAWAVFDNTGGYVTFGIVDDARNYALDRRERETKDHPTEETDSPTLVYPLYAANGIDPEEIQ